EAARGAAGVAVEVRPADRERTPLVRIDCAADLLRPVPAEGTVLDRGRRAAERGDPASPRIVEGGDDVGEHVRTADGGLRAVDEEPTGAARYAVAGDQRVLEGERRFVGRQAAEVPLDEETAPHVRRVVTDRRASDGHHRGLPDGLRG